MLKKLLSRKRLNILGINSGTSADGIDLALIRFSLVGRKPKIAFVDGGVRQYPAKVKTELERYLRAEDKSAEETARLDIALGHLLGRAAAEFIGKGRHRVNLIGSHGQTVGHYPQKKACLNFRTGTTIQIGDGDVIARRTGLPVVSDFRRADIAGGGEGAPLTPFVNQMLFGDKTRSRIIINIGGIANYSYHPAGGDISQIRGGDCGPGNILSDTACRLFYNRRYDLHGRIAGRGKPLQKIMAMIEKANKGRRISAGREQFDQKLLARLIHAAGGLKADRADIVASIAAATAQTIYKSIRPQLKDKRLEAVFLTGGGRRNRFIVDCLRKLIHPVRVQSVETLGYDGDLLEAVSFALLGGCFIMGVPSTLPHISGGEAGGVAGKLSLPPM
ncbi:MAG: hypothetical protein GY841_13695 [FCB group bacterium]|nr:hypothetical protein [FCB group bacterium]